MGLPAGLKARPAIRQPQCLGFLGLGIRFSPKYSSVLFG
jgi:hypothetical protein